MRDIIMRLAYGKSGLDLDLPEQAVVSALRLTPSLPDETASIRETLRAEINVEDNAIVYMFICLPLLLWKRPSFSTSIAPL